MPEPVKTIWWSCFFNICCNFIFCILNIIFGQGDELVEKMKKEEARIARSNKLSKIISTLPSGILTF